MKHDSEWIFDNKFLKKVRKEINQMPKWKNEYYQRMYVEIGKTYMKTD